MAYEIYQEVSEEWANTIASRYPELASMAIFDAFDVPWIVVQDVKSACRTAARLTGRRYTVEKKGDKLAQVKRVG